MMNNSTDTQLLADGCTALLRLVFGDNNWYRWNEIKQQTQMDSLQSFITWMLDVAEQEINRPANDETNILAESKYSVNPEVKCEDVSQIELSDNKVDSLPAYFNEPQEEYVYGAAADVASASYYEDGGGGEKEVEGEGDDEVVMLDNGTRANQQYDNQYHLSLTPAITAASASADTTVEVTYDCKVFFCNSCTVSLSDIEVLKEHLKLRHSDKHESISCFCCQNIFSSIQSYVEFHKATAVSPNSKAKKFICDHCAKSFKVKQDLQDHIANKHLKMGPRHECPNCLKKFSHANNLRIHKKKCTLSAM